MKSSKKLVVISVCAIALVLAILGATIGVSIYNGLKMPEEIPLTDLASTYDGEIKDEEGNLLVPFDVAYPEEFSTGAYKYNEDVLLLKLKEGFGDKINSNLENCGFESIEQFLKTDNGTWYRAKLTEGTEAKVAIQKARSLSEVLMADFDYIYETGAADIEYADEVQENPLLDQQYYLGQSNIQEAWEYLEENGISAGGSSSVVVAVIDTGVDYNHPDLKANMWVNTGEIPNNGYDDDGNGYVDDYYGCSTIGSEYNHNGNPMDDHGHGTHVAGIIAASNNKEGIVGIAYNVKVMAIKAGQATGVFNQSDIAEAIIYAYQMGADVINMSFGGAACSIAIQDALSTAYTTATLVAAAGNSSMPNEGLYALPNYPAALSYVVGVMSVDRYGTESAFTNYDVKAFTKVEYEIYAAGEGIMSTLPDGRYGSLSGTSMATPMVSAAAAILRSYFTDRDMYPSKFISAQLCATSEHSATCCNPSVHGDHNIPMILDIEAALTKLPKPDIQVYDFYFFDPQTYNGVTYDNNNGDGVADAGETLLVGLVLRNRWGMSENTLVSVDAKSSLGVDSPYVEIIQGEVNFEGIGTYSTKSTLIYNEENVIIGISDPIIIKISDDCPNDYLVGLNVYMTYENALDEDDTTVYEYGEAGSYEVEFWARNGYILPSQITEDMTLTKDNYYIMPNSTYIYEGVTVTVEPGTKIQFWSDDPNDPYADTYMAYLNVAGNFICQGTEEEPVELFPSDMMSNYRVEIRQQSNAVVDLSYTTITNPYIDADNIDHCTFKYNYNENLYYRYLSEGRVHYSSSYGMLSATKVTNSLFYKCGGGWSSFNLYGNYESCSFVDSHCSYGGNYSNCVFMGNNNEGYVSTINISNTLSTGVDHVLRNSNTGTTYVAVYFNANGSAAALNTVRKIAQAWGGDIACFETEEEWNFIRNSYISNYSSSYYRCGIGIESSSSTTWVNGEPIGDYILNNYYKYDDGSYGNCTGSIYKQSSYYSSSIYFDSSLSYYLIEIPGSIYVDQIYLRDYNVSIDNESTYQINASVVPSTFDKSNLIYVSEDERIATVSESGLVTPVSEGKTRIFVYSPDYKAYGVFDISIIDKVPVTEVKFEDMIIEFGSCLEAIPTYSPINTTQRGLTYSSENTSVATVNEYGMVYANGTGTTKINVTAQNGNTYSFNVKVVSKVESIKFENAFYVTHLNDIDESWKPVIYPANATDYVVNYSSSNENVAYVDSNGQLVRAGIGVATIRAEIEGTNLYAEINVSVSESQIDSPSVVDMDYYDYTVLAVTDDGSLWVWGRGQQYSNYINGSWVYTNSNIRVPTKIASGVKSAKFGYLNSSSYSYITYVKNDGSLGTLSLSWSSNSVTAYEYNRGYESQITDKLTKIYRYSNSYYALTENGMVYVGGDNSYGQLCVGTTENLSTFALVGITDVKDILPFDCSAAFLTNAGELYVAGTYYNKYTSPHKLDSDVSEIRGYGNYLIYEKKDGSQYSYYSNNSDEPSFSISSYRTYYRYSDVYVENGKLYYSNSLVSGVENIDNMFVLESVYYALTDDGSIYGFGENSYYQLADLTTTNRYYEAKKIFFGLGSDNTLPEVESNNLEEDVLHDNKLVIDYNVGLLTSSNYPNIKVTDSKGMIVYFDKEIRLDKVILTPLYELKNGETYTLTIPNNSFVTAWGNSTSTYTLQFTYANTTEIEFLDSSIKNGEVLTDGNLNATINYTFATAGDNFFSISLTKDGQAVTGFNFSVDNGALTLSATGLEVGEYTLSIPQGALCDNVGGENDELVYTLTVPAAEEVVYVPLAITYSSLDSKTSGIALYPQWVVVMNKEFTLNSSLITLVDAEGNSIGVYTTVNKNTLVILASQSLSPNTTYTISVKSGALTDEKGAKAEAIEATFTTLEQSERFLWTIDSFAEEYRKEVYKNAFNYRFYNNAVLNNFNDTNVEHWLRFIAGEGSINDKIGLGHNWWGTTLEEMIDRQIVDFDDYQSLRDIVYTPYLTEAPSNTFPFVVAAYLINANGERVNKVGNETVTFVIEFNRDMDTSIPLRVRFGSSEPYAEYEIDGEYVSARRWEGTYTLKTTIENGRQYFKIENGAAADDGYLALYETAGRFGFEIDTTAAQALIMLGEATENGIKLTWTQDDFDTLAGYNVYRSTSENGYYTRINSYVIPADTKEFFDDTVEPGQRYYYNFTVVKTDLSESTPSGKINLMSLDTMAPNIYHSPVYTAYTGSNLLISATVTDNLGINKVFVHYRTVGSEEWKTVEMIAHNSRYTGVILADYIDIDGLEYYIEANDGRNSTYKGSANDPYSVIVKLAVDANSKGDVDGDGVITNKDALMVLQATNDLLNLTEEQFLRADLNDDGELSASEALRILQYVSGKVTTIVD